MRPTINTKSKCVEIFFGSVNKGRKDLESPSFFFFGGEFFGTLRTEANGGLTRPAAEERGIRGVAFFESGGVSVVGDSDFNRLIRCTCQGGMFSLWL